MAKIAVLLADDFEDEEFSTPFNQLVSAGHQVVILGAKKGVPVAGKHRQATAQIEAAVSDQSANSFDALLIPGGFSPEYLRSQPEVVEFVRSFAKTGRPLAAVCHGPELLIEANVVAGKTVTTWPSVRHEIENAGGKWIDQEVVVDRNVITSRNSGHMNAFFGALLSRL